MRSLSLLIISTLCTATACAFVLESKHREFSRTKEKELQVILDDLGKVAYHASVVRRSRGIQDSYVMDFTGGDIGEDDLSLLLFGQGLVFDSRNLEL